MRLFYLINSWAGRSEWLDAALRFFYVGALPLLATALAAMIFLTPSRRDFPRRRIAFSALLAFALCAGVMAFVPFFQKQFLGGAPISPRPFMTHWVTALVVEANDNSFPCFEVMLAAAFATLLWAGAPWLGVIGWSTVFVLAFARTFCGMNYVGDSVGGAVLGAALSAFSLALMRVRLQLPAREGSTARLSWRVRHQGALSVVVMAGFAVFTFISLLISPAHGAKFKSLWGNPAASAAPVVEAAIPPTAKASSALIPTGIGESEGGTLAGQNGGMVAPGESLLSSRATRLDGHLPQAEQLLMQALNSLRLPHRIVGINVAQVKAGNTPYRVAAIRFEVKNSGALERRRVTESAVAFLKTAFHADGQLQHVDMIAVQLGDAASKSSGALSETALKAHAIHGGARPVFTASVVRSDLILKNKPAWTNWEKLEPGMWLRARSLLYIDPKVLPPLPATPLETAPPKPVSTPTPKPVVIKPKQRRKPLVKDRPVKKSIVKKPARKRAVIRKRAPVRRARKRTVSKRRTYRTRNRTYRTRRYRNYR